MEKQLFVKSYGKGWGDNSPATRGEYVTYNPTEITKKEFIEELKENDNVLAIYQGCSNSGPYGLIWEGKKRDEKAAFDQFSQRELAAWIRSLSRETYHETIVYYFPLFHDRDGKIIYIFANWIKDDETGEKLLIASIGQATEKALIIDATDFELPFIYGKEVFDFEEIITPKCKAAEIAKRFSNAIKELISYKWDYSK